MQEILWYWSAALAHLYYLIAPSPRVVIRTETVTVVEKDPNGIIRNDLALITKYLPELKWKAGMSIEEIAHVQGQHDLFNMIQNKVVGRR